MLHHQPWLTHLLRSVCPQWSCVRPLNRFDNPCRNCDCRVPFSSRVLGDGLGGARWNREVEWIGHVIHREWTSREVEPRTVMVNKLCFTHVHFYLTSFSESFFVKMKFITSHSDTTWYDLLWYESNVCKSCIYQAWLHTAAKIIQIAEAKLNRFKRHVQVRKVFQQHKYITLRYLKLWFCDREWTLSTHTYSHTPLSANSVRPGEKRIYIFTYFTQGRTRVWLSQYQRINVI